MLNVSTEYEILVRDLHEALLRNDAVENISVQHNVTIVGKSGASHQIDVYWEFKLAGVTYKTCIECKHYNNRVKKTDVSSFAMIIQDIGNTTGIFATTVGYQRGAILLAKQYGIRLITVNHILKSINLSINIISPQTSIINIKYDTDQAKKLLELNNVKSYSFIPLWNKNTQFFDENGAEKIKLNELLNQEIISDGDGIITPESLYENTDIGLIRITEISYRRVTIHIKTENEIMANATEKAIMEDIIENSSCYLNDDGSVSNKLISEFWGHNT